MKYSHYPHGFPNGVSIEGIPFAMIQNANGNTFWVDSNKGSNGNNGTENHPFATIIYAVGRCTADQGDVIYVAPGHSETVISQTAFVISIAGISIIGLGNRENRPKISFTTDTASLINVGADDVRISNIVFESNIASHVTQVYLAAKRSVIENCYFTEGTATCNAQLDIDGGGVNTCDGAIIRNCEFYSPTAGGLEAIELGKTQDSVSIINCTVWGDFSNGCINGAAGAVCTNLTIGECTLYNLNSGSYAVLFPEACTGVARNLYMYTDTYATTIDPGSLACFECYSVSTVDKNARLNPVVET